jgi:competence protein ComEC
MITLVLAFQFSRKQLFYVSIISILVLGLIVNQQLWSKHNSNRLIIFNVNDQMAIGLINGAKPILYSNADSIQQAFIQYSVIPALEAYSSIQYLSFIKEPVKFHLNDISITNNHLQFMEKQLLILDGRKNHPIATAPDWLLVRNNPKRPLDSLLDTLKKSTLLILDGSNSRHTIDRWRADAERLNIEFYCLKDNFAYVWSAK